MNAQIEIINPHLVGVKFAYVKLGWVKDFPPLYPDEDLIFDTPHMSLITDGVLILNKDDEKQYNAMKDMFNNRIMPMSDSVLTAHLQEIKSLKDTPKFDSFTEEYLWMLETEQTRRTAIKSIKPDGIICKIGRMVKKCLQSALQ